MSTTYEIAPATSQRPGAGPRMEVRVQDDPTPGEDGVLTPLMAAEIIRDDVLIPVLDARALNTDQALLIANPSEEVDSLEEYVRALDGAVHPRVVSGLLALCRRLAESNDEEGEIERAIAGTSERLAAQLYRTRGKSQPLGIRKVANQLRTPLGVLAKPREFDGIAYFKASCVVRDVIEQMPADRLRCDWMRNELGRAKFELLVRLAATAETEAVPS